MGLNSWFSGMLHRIVWWMDTNVSGDLAASIFRVEDGYYPIITLHGATTQKTMNSIFTAMKTSDLLSE